MIPLITLTYQTGPVDANVITDWNENAVALVTPRMVPGAAQRVVAIMQVAMFDAVNSFEPRYRPYLIQLPATPATSKEAAATAAAGAVLATLIPQARDQVRGAPAARRDGGYDPPSAVMVLRWQMS